jgi:hypothetical protein
MDIIALLASKIASVWACLALLAVALNALVV